MTTTETAGRWGEMDCQICKRDVEDGAMVGHLLIHVIQELRDIDAALHPRSRVGAWHTRKYGCCAEHDAMAESEIRLMEAR